MKKCNLKEFWGTYSSKLEKLAKTADLYSEYYVNDDGVYIYDSDFMVDDLVVVTDIQFDYYEETLAVTIYTEKYLEEIADRAKNAKTKKARKMYKKHLQFIYDHWDYCPKSIDIDTATAKLIFK